MVESFSFPENFLWGTAVAGYQCEGNSTNADWWQWEQGAGHIAEGHKSGRACDWWEGRRWQEDFDRAMNDGHTALRLSVEWSRVEPSPGRWDESALEHYREMVLGLRQRGLEPMVTLHHFANPVWVTEQSLWETGEAVTLFEKYVSKVMSVLGEHARLWCTFNEPNVFFGNGWVGGVFPPGKKSVPLALKVTQTVARAHAAAYRAVHASRPDALVGLPIHFRPMEPANPANPLDRWVANTQFNLFSAVFPEALRFGKVRGPTGSILLPEVKGAWDFFGLQYYTADVVRFDLANPGELFGRRSLPPGAELDDAKFYASYPPGLAWSLNWARQFGLPIIITENGIGDADDKMRPRYVLSHLIEVGKALRQGFDVRGYFHWSLVDNFEWERGWMHRFGLYALDTDTQQRTPRPSARMYSEICTSRAITPAIVSRYAPELM
ncbi:MAG TPA: family 1 glycosylhydrolase [Anaerolineales bacterium]|nr:family 1 glycosylhydrolase [Anaerolineales bacterium]